MLAGCKPIPFHFRSSFCQINKNVNMHKRNEINLQAEKKLYGKSIILQISQLTVLRDQYKFLKTFKLSETCNVYIIDGMSFPPCTPKAHYPTENSARVSSILSEI